MPGTWRIACAVVLIFAVHAAALYYLGQPPICACGYVQLWHTVVTDAQNSQHLFDWYTLSHIVHGVLFYALFTLLFPRLPIGYRLLMSVALEASWEILENSPWVINRYREQALAQGYFGDSIINSLADGFAALAGFFVARKISVSFSIALIVFLELLALSAVRDNLTLNIIQLLHPFDAIGLWQAGK